MARSVRTRVAAVASLVLGLATLISPVPGRATAPAPPLEGCAADGGWDIADDCGLDFVPRFGWQFGRIDSVVTQPTTMGGEVTFSYPVRSPRPLGDPVSCGDLGCVA